MTVVSKVDRAAGERSHRWPHALPGGKTILYSVGLGGSWDNAKVVAHRLDTGERKVVLSEGSDARYVPTGHLVYVRGPSLYTVPFDADALEVQGQPVEVTSGSPITAGGAEFAFSPNGTLVYFSPGVGGDEGGHLALMNRRGERVRPSRSIGEPSRLCDNTPSTEGAEGVSRINVLVGTMRRLHSGRELTIDADVSPAHEIRGRKEDLDEMLGNLLDNACKWARSRVAISSSINHDRLVISVDDDGPGLDPSMRAQVLQRGVRADQRIGG